MPELPEVETVRRKLESETHHHPVIDHVELFRSDIRFPIPKDFAKKLKGQPIQRIRRRAKYLLFDTPKVSLLSHLGMTGSWRILKEPKRGVHDHCFVHLQDGRILAFRDPRRFGMLDLVQRENEATHPRLKNLGPEPLDMNAFHADYLFQRTRKRKTLIKSLIMDQKIVVGVGNIYASEALFWAKIRPTRWASRITQGEAKHLVEAIRKVLNEAIQAGGSSIRDYRNPAGEAGQFQASHQVYDRANKPCLICGNPIRSKVISGRSTYWCPHCQK